MSVHPAAGIILGSSCRTREELRGTGHVRTRCFDRVMPPPTSILCLLPAADKETSSDVALVHSRLSIGFLPGRSYTQNDYLSCKVSHGD